MVESNISSSRLLRGSSDSHPAVGVRQLLVVAGVVVALVVGSYGVVKKIGFVPYPQYPPNLWQSVFLENGQVYFGHVVTVNRHTVRLRDIFYLRVISQPLQSSQPPNVPPLPEQQFTLIKLGNELHGPVDEMDLNRDHVLLIENLKDDSRVVVAIKDYLTKQAAQP